MVLTEFDIDKYEAMIRTEGEMKTLVSLVEKKIITLKQALEACGLEEKEFLKELELYGSDIKNNEKI